MDRAETRFKSKKVTNLNTNWELNKIGTFLTCLSDFLQSVLYKL